METAFIISHKDHPTLLANNKQLLTDTAFTKYTYNTSLLTTFISLAC